MKAKLTHIVCAHLVMIAASCALAQQNPIRAIPITVQVLVRNPDGLPVEGAVVHLSLPRHRLGDQNQWSDAITNARGEATVSGMAQQDYQVGVDKAGSYHTTGPHRAIDTDSGFQNYAAGVQKLDLELRPIRNPTRSIRKTLDRVRLPAADGPFGYDLEIGDWVTPYGRGQIGDFILKLEGSFKSQRDYDQSLTLTFRNPGDGIILTRFSPDLGPVFKFPYEAPLTGYEPQRTWRMRWSLSGGSTGTSIDPDGETNYIFRVRTELDDKGNVRRALYGTISGDLTPVGGNAEIGRNVSFTYSLNPDWTRNLEFDPAKATRPR